ARSILHKQKLFGQTLEISTIMSKDLYIYDFLCGMQSMQQVESTNGTIKSEINAKTLLLNLLPSIQSIFFESIYNEIRKYLILESASVQNVQISQSVLYRAYLYEVSNNSTSFPSAHEYEEGYFEDEYDALQASLENIINIVNHNNILEVWHVSLFDQRDHSYPHYVVLLADNMHICTCLYIISNGFYCRHFSAIFKMSCDAKFDIKLISKCWYTDPMQASNYSIITGTAAAEFDTVEFGTKKQEYAYSFGVAKSGLKFTLENGLVNEFVGLIVKFIDSHSGVATSEQCPRLLDSAQQNTLQDLNANCNLNSSQDKLRREDEIETENEYSKTLTSKVEGKVEDRYY
ncbi:17867_t:CDS:2, partial [Gigaspora margarita]